MKHPVAGEALKLYGTNVLVNILNTVGGLPTKNFRYGQYAEHDKISGETMRATIIERKGHPQPCLSQRVCHPVFPGLRGQRRQLCHLRV